MARTDMLNSRVLRFENKRYAGTRGVSENNRDDKFYPAFLNKRDGRVEIAKKQDGSPAPFHLIDWLPEEWATGIDTKGRVRSLQPEIIAGFVREGIFFTREEVTAL